MRVVADARVGVLGGVVIGLGDVDIPILGHEVVVTSIRFINIRMKRWPRHLFASRRNEGNNVPRFRRPCGT